MARFLAVLSLMMRHKGEEVVNRKRLACVQEEENAGGAHGVSRCRGQVVLLDLAGAGGVELPGLQLP